MPFIDRRVPGIFAAVVHGMTRVDELMSALPRTIWTTQSLTDAVSLFDHATPAAVVVDLAGRPVGLITKAAVAREAARRPTQWSRTRCAHLLEPMTTRLRPDDALEGVLAQYRDGGTRPLLVFNGSHPVGVLYPEYVLASTPASERPPAPESTMGVKPAAESR